MLQAVIAWPPRRLVCHMEVVSDTGESDKLSLVTSIIAKRACILFCFSLKYLMLLLVAGPRRVASKAPDSKSKNPDTHSSMDSITCPSHVGVRSWSMTRPLTWRPASPIDRASSWQITWCVSFSVVVSGSTVKRVLQFLTLPNTLYA